MKIQEKINYMIKPIQSKFASRTPRNKILDDLCDVQEQLEQARTLFDILDNKDLIESCIYQIESLEVKYNYLIKQARIAGITYNELSENNIVTTKY